MGASFSGCEESFSERGITSVIRDYNQTISSYKIQQLQSSKSHKILKWRKELKKQLSQSKTGIHHWNAFRQAISDYIESSAAEANVEWIINVKLISFSLPSYSTKFIHQQPMQQSPRQAEKIDFILSDISPQRENKLQYTITTQVDPLSAADHQNHDTSRYFKTPKLSKSCPNNKLSAKEELRKIISSQITNSKHIVNQLIYVFHHKFEELFIERYNNLDITKYTDQDEVTYRNIIDLIKSFVRVLRKFLLWVYEELIEQFKLVLKLEDLSPGYILEYEIYNVLFSYNSSIMYKMLIALIKMKNSSTYNSLLKKFQAKKTQKLMEYDTHLKASTLFVMDDIAQPYTEVTTKLAKLCNQTNPYKKFETILSLEAEMLTSLERYHTEFNLRQKLQKNFGMDMKFPILQFCIVNSGNTNLIADRILIEEFVNQNYLSNVQNFVTFSTCLDFLIESQSFVEENHISLTFGHPPLILLNQSQEVKV